MRMLHTSDLHLGSGFKGLGSKKGDKRRADLRKVFRRIAELAKEKNADLLLIVGDLFDSPYPMPSTVEHVNEVLRGLDDVPVILVPGNHDYYSEDSVYSTNEFPDNVTVVTSFDFDRIKLPNLIVYAAAYDRENPSRRALENFRLDEEEDRPVAVAVHGSYTYGIDWAEDPEGKYYPITPDDRKGLTGVHYLALGHYHEFKEIKTDVHTCYPGTPEGLFFKEVGARYVALVDIDNLVKVQRIPVNIREYQSLDLDCTGFENVAEVRREIEFRSDKNKLLRLKLVGYPSPAVKIDVDELEGEYSEGFFHLEISDETLPSEMPELSNKTMKGVFVKKILSEIEEADGERKRVLNLAVRYGLAALEDRL